MSGAVKIYGASILPSGATSPLQTPAIWHLGNCTLCATHYVGNGWQSFHKLNAIPPVVKLAARLAWRRIKAMIPAGWDWTQGAEMWRPSTHFGVSRFGSLTAFCTFALYLLSCPVLMIWSSSSTDFHLVILFWFVTLCIMLRDLSDVTLVCEDKWLLKKVGTCWHS